MTSRDLDEQADRPDDAADEMVKDEMIKDGDGG